MKLLQIKAGDKLLITDNVEKKTYYSSRLGSLLFDGKNPVLSYSSDWFIVPNFSKIQRRVSGGITNYRYELKDKNFAEKGFQSSYKREDCQYYDNDEGWINKEFFDVISSLYGLKYDKEEGRTEDIEFEIEEVGEISEIPDWANFKNTYRKPIIYSEIDKIIFPKVALHTRPCAITSEESYKLVRKYIKQHINLEVAEITSDYDFCFTVKKIIPLLNPEPYRVNVNHLTRRKPKYIDKIRKSEKHECFQMTYSPKNYNKYTPLPAFRGENLKDLNNNIEKYLKDLITRINQPLSLCPNCKGHGVIK